MNKKIYKWMALMLVGMTGLAVLSVLSFQLFRQLLVEENEALVHSVAQRMLPALLINDGQQVEVLMKALESYPGVQSAELVNTQGASIASYARGVGQVDATPHAFALASALDDPNQLYVSAPITFDSLIIGNLHMAVTLWPTYLRIMTWLGLLLIVPSALFVLVRQLRIKVRFEKVVSLGGPGSGSREALFDLHASTGQAMSDADISLEYQPIRRLSDGGLLGMELVVCWRHPSGQTLHVSPANFVTLAEKVGICLPFDAWLLRASLEKSAVWQRQHGPLVLTIDVSETQFKDPLFPRLVRDACDAAQYPYQLLELEVRESVLTRQLSIALKAMEEFAANGLTLTIESFGLTQNSLQLLKKLPIKKVKLDAKLIKNFLRDTHVFLLVQATISYAHACNVQVSIEGIETSPQCEEIQKTGCLLGQGAYLNQPLSVKDFDMLLTHRRVDRVDSLFEAGTSMLVKSRA